MRVYFIFLFVLQVSMWFAVFRRTENEDIFYNMINYWTLEEAKEYVVSKYGEEYYCKPDFEYDPSKDFSEESYDDWRGAPEDNLHLGDIETERVDELIHGFEYECQICGQVLRTHEKNCSKCGSSNLKRVIIGRPERNARKDDSILIEIVRETRRAPHRTVQRKQLLLIKGRKKQVECVNCGKVVPYSTNKPLRCPRCKKERRKKQERERYLKKKNSA